MAQAEARIVLNPLMQQLPERDRRVVHMRFYGEQTQQEVAEALGLNPRCLVSWARVLTDLRIRSV